MLAITEYNYFKPAAGVPAERSIHTPPLIVSEIKMYKYHRNRRFCRKKDCKSVLIKFEHGHPKDISIYSLKLILLRLTRVICKL